MKYMRSVGYFGHLLYCRLSGNKYNMIFDGFVTGSIHQGLLNYFLPHRPPRFPNAIALVGVLPASVFISPELWIRDHVDQILFEWGFLNNAIVGLYLNNLVVFFPNVPLPNEVKCVWQYILRQCYAHLLRWFQWPDTVGPFWRLNIIWPYPMPCVAALGISDSVLANCFPTKWLYVQKYIAV